MPHDEAMDYYQASDRLIFQVLTSHTEKARKIFNPEILDQLIVQVLAGLGPGYVDLFYFECEGPNLVKSNTENDITYGFNFRSCLNEFT